MKDAKLLEKRSIGEGPLLAVLMASGIDERGQPVDPQLRFSPSARRVTAIVPLLDAVTGQVLTIAWYRFAGETSRKPLFRHRIKVKPFHHAYSVGVTGSRLLGGTYEVVATVGKHEVRSSWVVRAETASVGSEASAEPPGPGDSGLREGAGAEAPEPSQASGSEQCSFSVSADQQFISIYAVARGSPGDCGEVWLAARANGPWAALAKGENIAHYEFHPCQLPGGSDVPGTVIQVGGVLLKTEEEQVAEVVLEDAEHPPFVAIDTTPRPGSAVSPGHTITLRALALELPLAGFPGIRSLELVGPGGRITFDEYEVKACDIERFRKLLESSYTVPSDPPRVIEICAIAVNDADFEGRDCATFSVAEVWVGTFRFTIAGHPTIDVRFRGRVRVEVNADGAAVGVMSGRGVAVDYGGSHPFTSTCQVGGRREAMSLVLDLQSCRTNPPLPAPGGKVTAAINGKTATWSRAGAYDRSEMTLRCNSC